MTYTSYLVKYRQGHRRHDPDTRAQLAQSFRSMYRNLGLDLAGCAQLLHVTERTLHNWASGKHDIPYATYRLLRLLNRMELPGKSWEGWCFHGGKLWSPEGRSFVGTDSSWWSLLVRRASCFDAMFQRTGQLEKALVALEVDRQTKAATRAQSVALVAERRTPSAQAQRADGGSGEDGRAPSGDRREAPVPNLLIVHFRTQQHVFGANAASYAINPIAKTTFSLVAANNSKVRGTA